MALKFRRGTTAQKSGSLAFGEPYVNTTLGTLQIGTDTGDVTLATQGATSTGQFGFISGSGLEISGNATIFGNLTLGGNITIGDQTSDTVVVSANLSSSLIPSNDNAFDLGSSSKKYKDAYLAGNITVGGTVDGVDISVLNTNINSFSASVNTSISNLNSTTASLNTSVSNINSFTSSASGRLSNLESTSASLNTSVSNLNTTTASLNTSVSNLNSFSASENSKGLALATLTGSYDSRFTTLATYTGSVESRFSTLATLTGSYDTRHTAIGTYTSSLETRMTAVGTATGSINTSITNLNLATASLIVDTNNLETFTSSFNTAFGLSGANVTVKGNLTVQGTTTQIDSTVVNIADNIIQLNGTGATNAGLVVRDATAATTTSGSLLWDTTNDYWIVGPLGSELPIATTTGTQTLTNKTISGASNTLSNIANASLSNSAITIAGTSTSLGGSITLATITGTSGIVSGSSQVTPLLPAGTISGSSQVTGISNAQLTNSSVTIGTTAISLGASSTTLAGLTSVTSTGFTGALTGNASTATTLQTARTINGTSFNGSADITIPNLVSGSGQISGTGITNNTITIAGTSTALGGTITLATITGNSGIVSGSSQINGTSITNNTISIAGTSTALGGSITAAVIGNAIGAFSGSAQVSHDSTTGYSANRHIDHTAVSISAGSGLTGGGDISSTRTLSIATSGVTDAMLAGSISNGKLANSAITIAGTSTSLGGTITLATITGTSGIISGSSQISGLTTSNLNGTAGITNGQLANSSVTVTAGTGMSGGGSVSLGGSVTLTNAGVTSVVAGTGVSVSGATGAVTISIGQSVATSATPTFAGLTINGAITATGDITAYYTSDKRHKNNIQIIPNALEKVSKLNGVTWEWNDDVNEVTKSTPKTGLIAQDVQSVLPEVVKEREDGFLSLDYSKMMGLMVEAIKEQQTQIHKLNLEIEVLKKQKGL